MKNTLFFLALAASTAVFTNAYAQNKDASEPKVVSEPDLNAPVKAAPAVRYDFKGAKLGMTIEEWKAVEPPIDHSKPISAGEGPDRIWCSTDRTPDGELAKNFVLSESEKALGVISCKYGRQFLSGKTYMEIIPSEVKIGNGGSSDVEYNFLDGHLYEISITGRASLLNEMLDIIKSKFGLPTTEVNDMAKNKEGSTFPHATKIWANPIASITVETPYSKIDNLNVSFIAIDLASRILAKKRSLHPASD